MTKPLSPNIKVPIYKKPESGKKNSLEIEIYLGSDFKEYIVNVVGNGENTAKDHLRHLRRIARTFNHVSFGRAIHDNESSLNYLECVLNLLSIEGLKEGDDVLSKSAIRNMKAALNAYLGFIDTTLPSDSNILANYHNQEKVCHNHYIDDNVSYSFDKKELFTKFKFRFATQEILDTPIFFQISFIQKLFNTKGGEARVFFNDWLDQMINNIKVITEHKTYYLEDIDGIDILNSPDSCINYVIVKDEKIDLMTPTKGGSTSEMSTDKLQDIELHHIKPLREILKENEHTLKGLKILTDYVSSYTGSSDLRQSAGERAAEVMGSLLDNEELIELLKLDLNTIGEQTEIVLMDRNETAEKED